MMHGNAELIEVTKTALVLCFALFIYLVPAIVARTREHNNSLAITAANIMTGWTVLGWIATMIWSLTDNRRRHPKRTAEFLD